MLHRLLLPLLLLPLQTLQPLALIRITRHRNCRLRRYRTLSWVVVEVVVARSSPDRV